MSAMQRRKGRSGEQAVARIIRDHMGIDVTRNWAMQSAVGGTDLVGLEGWAIEVKWQKLDKREQWWIQACEQAKEIGAKPVLIFRVGSFGRGKEDQDKWQCAVFLRDIGLDVDAKLTGLVTLRGWMQIAREQLLEVA